MMVSLRFYLAELQDCVLKCRCRVLTINELFFSLFFTMAPSLIENN